MAAVGGWLRPVTARAAGIKDQALLTSLHVGVAPHAVVEGPPAGGAGVETVGLPGTELTVATPRSRGDDGGRGGAQGSGGHSAIWKRVRKGFCRGPLSQDEARVCDRVMVAGGGGVLSAEGTPHMNQWLFTLALSQTPKFTAQLCHKLCDREEAVILSEPQFPPCNDRKGGAIEFQ